MLPIALHILLVLSPLLTFASPAPKSVPSPKPCTLHSPTTGSYFDLSTISLSPPSNKGSHKSDERTTSWHARGYDYGADFMLNICAPVIEDLAEMGGVKGVEEGRWANVSGYYEWGGERFSIG
jgi:cation-dependent mannose-6-phosphate receptor